MRRRTFQSHEDAFSAAELLGKLEVASLRRQYGDTNEFNVIRTRTSSTRPPIVIKGQGDTGTARTRAAAAAVPTAAEDDNGRHLNSCSACRRRKKGRCGTDQASTGCLKLPKATGKRDNRDGSPEKENKAKRQKKAIEKAPRIGEHLQAELEGRPRADTRKLKIGKGVLASDGQALYEARVIDIDKERAVDHYKVHFLGWNSKFDKWVSTAELRHTDDDAPAVVVKKAQPSGKAKAEAASAPTVKRSKKRRETATGVRARAVVDGLPNLGGTGLNGNFWGSPGRPTVPAPVKLKLSVEALAGDRALRMFETMKCKVALDLPTCQEAQRKDAVHFLCAYHTSNRKNPQPLAVLGWLRKASCLRRTVINIVLAATCDGNPTFCQALELLVAEAIKSPQSADCLWIEVQLDGLQETASMWKALKFEVDAEAQRALMAIRPFRRELAVGGKIFTLQMQPAHKAVESAKEFMKEDHNGLTYMLRTLERVAEEAGHWHATQMVYLNNVNVGFVCARVTVSRRKPTLEVMALYVLEQYREKGMGQALVTSLLQAAAVGIMGKEGLPHAQARVTLPFCMQHSKGFWERYGFDTSAGHFAVLRSIEKVL